MSDAITSEIELRGNELNKSIDTIYFGGGTPSVLSENNLQKIFNSIYKTFTISEQAEVTLESNPEDLTRDKVAQIKNLGVNRLSIGIQTFEDDLLKLINRNHTEKEALQSIEFALEQGIENLNLDLIFGLPSAEADYFKKDLEKMIEINPAHLSIYGLTIEEKTVFGNWAKKGKIHVPDDEIQLHQYMLAEKYLTEAGYIHYEVSNYCKEEKYSRHNNSYWLQEPYLGIGPSAHSYLGKERKINVSSNHEYMKNLEEKKTAFEIEVLDSVDLVNEYLLTRLRTHFGIDLNYLKNELGKDLISDFGIKIAEYEQGGYLTRQNDKINLTKKGFPVADQITMDFFYEK